MTCGSVGYSRGWALEEFDRIKSAPLIGSRGSGGKERRYAFYLSSFTVVIIDIIIGIAVIGPEFAENFFVTPLLGALGLLAALMSVALYFITLEPEVYKEVYKKINILQWNMALSMRFIYLAVSIFLILLMLVIFTMSQLGLLDGGIIVIVLLLCGYVVFMRLVLAGERPGVYSRKISRRLVFLSEGARVGGNLGFVVVMFLLFSSIIFSLNLLDVSDGESAQAASSWQTIVSMVGGAFLGWLLAIFYSGLSVTKNLEKALHEGRRHLRSIEMAADLYFERRLDRPRAATMEVIKAIELYLDWIGEFKYGQYRKVIVDIDWHSTELWRFLRGEMMGEPYCSKLTEVHGPELRKIIPSNNSEQAAMKFSVAFAAGLRGRLEESRLIF